MVRGVTPAKDDKADAVIGMDKAGNIYFFQTAENLKKFRVPAGG
jgi:YHS domain-containing protein